jgi:hypothetical protein
MIAAASVAAAFRIAGIVPASQYEMGFMPRLPLLDSQRHSITIKRGRV